LRDIPITYELERNVVPPKSLVRLSRSEDQESPQGLRRLRFSFFCIHLSKNPAEVPPLGGRRPALTTLESRSAALRPRFNFTENSRTNRPVVCGSAALVVAVYRGRPLRLSTPIIRSAASFLEVVRNGLKTKAFRPPLSPGDRIVPVFHRGMASPLCRADDGISLRRRPGCPIA